MAEQDIANRLSCFWGQLLLSFFMPFFEWQKAGQPVSVERGLETADTRYEGRQTALTCLAGRAGPLARAGVRAMVHPARPSRRRQKGASG
ncbi:MAG: hypothetical protein D6740_11865 [Alphaproteobacteria bacterium]|nr:MAG: hypothetical protein D6740_11865 [Alphaproteobacteria bacterium]